MQEWLKCMHSSQVKRFSKSEYSHRLSLKLSGKRKKLYRKARRAGNRLAMNLVGLLHKEDLQEVQDKHCDRAKANQQPIQDKRLNGRDLIILQFVNLILV
jgi:hypothetical protein